MTSSLLYPARSKTHRNLLKTRHRKFPFSSPLVSRRLMETLTNSLSARTAPRLLDVLGYSLSPLRGWRLFKVYFRHTTVRSLPSAAINSDERRMVVGRPTE